VKGGIYYAQTLSNQGEIINILETSDPDLRPLGPPILGDFVGMRLDGFMSLCHPFYSRAGWQKKISLGEVLINGRKVRSSAKLKSGDHLTMYHPQSLEPEVNRGIRVLWESGGLMALFKPANLPMHANGTYLKNTLAWILNERFGDEWAAVHRLDMETSGIVLCAASTALRNKMGISWQQKNVAKKYLAIVNGQVERDSFVVDQPIGDLQDSKIRIKKWVSPQGQKAKTNFKVIERALQHTLLEATPITGRTNQIRIHAAYEGHVLVGDKLFHPDENVFLNYWENGDNEWVHSQTGFKRLCLHACELSFTNPETSEIINLATPMPSDMQELWAQLNGKLRTD